MGSKVKLCVVGNRGRGETWVELSLEPGRELSLEPRRVLSLELGRGISSEREGAADGDVFKTRAKEGFRVGRCVALLRARGNRRANLHCQAGHNHSESWIRRLNMVTSNQFMRNHRR